MAAPKSRLCRAGCRVATVMLLAARVGSSVGSSVGCTEDFAAYWEISDLRVLAIQANPPELFREDVMPGADPATEVRFEALVVDPRGVQVTYTWSFCPVESHIACLDYQDRMSDGYAVFEQTMAELAASGVAAAIPVESESREELEAIYRPAPQSHQASAPSEVSYPIRAYATEPLEMAFPNEDLHWFHTFVNPFGTLVGAWPSAILHVAGGGMEVLSQKRLTLTMQNPAPLLEVAAGETGISVCPSGQTPDDLPGCLLIKPRVTNANPEFVRDFIEIAPTDAATSPAFCQPFHSDPERPCTLTEEEDVLWVDSAGVLHLLACEAMRILPVFPDGSGHFPGYDTSFEAYQSIDLDIDTQELIVRDQEEEISVSWFVSGGITGTQLSWPAFTRTLDAAYYAPEEPPEMGGGFVTVWMIARDQRGGVGWQGIEIKIEPNDDCESKFSSP